MMEKSQTVAQSTKWSALTELLTKIAAPLINIVLARLLAPEVFGLVATFSVVTSFAEIFTDAGFQKYIVQHEFMNQEERDKSVNVAFWTNFLFSCIIWCIIFIFQEPIAKLVGSAGYGREIAILSLQIPVYAFSSIQTALFRREFRFRQLLPIRLVDSLLPFLITIPLAIMLENCWAIIIGTLSRHCVSALLLTIKSSWKPRLYYSFKRLREMISDCIWMLCDSIMIWLTSYSGILIVGRYLDSYYLGIYRMGISSVMPYLNLIYVMTAPVLFSALSRMQSQKEECNRFFLNYQRIASYIAIPIGVAIFVFRDIVTLVLLGADWIEASAMIGYVGLALPFSIVTAQYNSDYFRAMGKPRVAFLVQSGYLICILLCLPWAAKKSFEMLCVMNGVLYFAYAFISVTLLWIVFRVSFLSTLKNMMPAFLGSIIAAVVAMALKNCFNGAVLWQIFVGCISLFVYVLVLLSIPRTRYEIMQTEIIKKAMLYLKGLFRRNK